MRLSWRCLQLNPLIYACVMSCCQVLIVEDEKNTRDFLCIVIDNHQKLSLLGSIGSISEAREAIVEHGAPDILLIDLGLPDGHGVELFTEIKEHHPKTIIMVLSTFGDEKNVLNAIEAGASGYIHKDEPLDEIHKHLDSILQGFMPISPSIAMHVLKRLQPSSIESAGVVLSPREIDVLKMLSRGFNRNETASHLAISPHTITTHIKNIYRKLKVHSRTEAVFEATQMGLIKINEY